MTVRSKYAPQFEVWVANKKFGKSSHLSFCIKPISDTVFLDESPEKSSHQELAQPLQSRMK